MFGPPGAGKGTQSDNLAKDYKLFKVSSGDLLRKEIEKKTSLGEKIKTLIDGGNLVPDELINSIIEKIISNKNYSNNLIFDGYPRNLNQAYNIDKMLKKYNQKISLVLTLNVNENAVVKRISGRMICSKCGLTFNKFSNPPKNESSGCNHSLITRSDDSEKIIKQRFKTYTQETLPILDYYSKQGLLHKLDGMRQINEIYEEIREILGSLEP